MSFQVAEGAIIAERYRLVRLLGEGGMGAVWAATHTITRKPVALKFLKGDAAKNPAVVKRFLREARAASAVRHPNVVQIHDILQLDDGSPVMVMDFLQGESLGDRIAREQSLKLDAFARVMVPVISAVGTAHATGIVHRDLKPDNIFLEQTADGTLVPKVLDFGIAKLGGTEESAATAHLTRTGAMLGTPYYMSPEQAFGEKDVDHRTDIWAFGIIFYECLTGKRPVDGDNLGQLFKVIMTGAIAPIEQVAPYLPRDITELVGRMLSSDRAKRPQDLREVYEILRRHTDTQAQSFSEAKAPIFIADSTTTVPATLASARDEAFARSSPDESKGGTKKSRSRTLWLVVGAGSIVTLGGGGALLSLRSPASAEDARSLVASSATLTTSASPPPASSPAFETAPSDSSVPREALSANATPSSSLPSVPSSSATPKNEKRPPIPNTKTPAGGSQAKTTGDTPTKTTGDTPAPPPTKLPGGIVGAAPFLQVDFSDTQS